MKHEHEESDVREVPRHPIPRFATEAEERAFWQEHDTSEYFDWTRAERVRLPNLKPSTTTISIRLPAGLLDELKILANQRDVPYQSLMKMFLADRVAAERARMGHRTMEAPATMRSRGRMRGGHKGE